MPHFFHPPPQPTHHYAYVGPKRRNELTTSLANLRSVANTVFLENATLDDIHSAACQPYSCEHVCACVAPRLPSNGTTTKTKTTQAAAASCCGSPRADQLKPRLHVHTHHPFSTKRVVLCQRRLLQGLYRCWWPQDHVNPVLTLHPNIKRPCMQAQSMGLKQQLSGKWPSSTQYNNNNKTEHQENTHTLMQS